MRTYREKQFPNKKDIPMKRHLPFLLLAVKPIPFTDAGPAQNAKAAKKRKAQ